MKQRKLESVHIDIDKRIFEVNGEDISSNTSYFKLIFEGGLWTLETTKKNAYSSGR